MAEAERKRDKYQEMYAANAMTLSELRDKLEALEETRKTVERELALLEGRCETLQALDSLGSEERRTVYSMLGLRVEALPDKSLRVRGAFGEESLVCQDDRTSTR